jgi:hypothetical protein
MQTIVSEIVLFLVSSVVLYYLIKQLIYFSRKSISKTWKLDDKFVMSKKKYRDFLIKNKTDYATLHGWNKKHIFLSFGDDVVWECCWSDIDVNKSDKWRKNYNSCLEFMGNTPKFRAIVENSQTPDNKDSKIKPVETMNETECEIYLKKALEKEDYKLAEEIRKRLERFR